MMTGSINLNPGIMSMQHPHTPTRTEALALLKEFNSNESLIHHALAVEAVMRHAARQHGADEEEWGIIGLIHDV